MNERKGRHHGALSLSTADKGGLCCGLQAA